MQGGARQSREMKEKRKTERCHIPKTLTHIVSGTHRESPRQTRVASSPQRHKPQTMQRHTGKQTREQDLEIHIIVDGL